jgi:hypothetical protein
MGTHTMRVVKRVCRQEPWQLGTNCQGSNAPWGIAGFNPPARTVPSNPRFQSERE